MKSFACRCAVWFMLTAVLFSSVIPMLPKAYAETGVITVGQAIASNTGTASVEGYVVAHTTGTKSYDFEAPFANDFNLALADSPSERDAAKLLPVQLPSGFRSQFGLQANPGLIGTKIRVTGALEAYFSVPGLRNPTAIEKMTVTDPGPGPEPVEVTVAEARGMKGQTVILHGVVTADNAAIGGGKLSTYVQDETGGINLYAASPISLLEGDRVRVKGKIDEYRDLMEIIPESDGVEVLSSGHPVPAPKATSLTDLQEASLAEPLEGQLVRLQGFVQDIPATPAGGGYNITLIDGQFRSAILRVMEGAKDVSQIRKGHWYDITGILSQYNSYQIVPRKAADLQLSDPQPPAPSASGEYPSVVESVVDGDTIHLSVPVLGADKVRFVNIDTPETYHTPQNELDRNQLAHGLAAKNYINTLLKPGDEITVKVGEEAKDDYGRLLAQVIREADGLNVNLEMVRQGYAATYFIWPIGDDYETYSQAVKEAYEAKRGIWSDTDPLLELPFVFRAREQGKGLTRHVGNYYTKTYVTPEKWAEVPVEARVFFASAAEAEANGFVPSIGTDPQQPVRVQLLGVNDWHGKIDVTSTAVNRPGVSFGRADYLAAYLRAREAGNPNTLIMHSGDMVGGSSPVSALLQDEPTVEIMESIGFDVGTIGNHELDEGVDEMLRLIRGGSHPNGTPEYDGMNFPVLAANMEYKDSSNLVLEPYAVKEISGLKIGFIGVVTTAVPGIVMPTGIANMRFTDEAAAVNKFVPQLQAQGVEAIVVLAHVPGVQDGSGAKGEIADLALKINDAVDVIFAAHNHVKVNAVVDNKLIVQAWEYGNAFVDIDLELDPVTRDIVRKSAEIVDVIQAGATPDPSAAAILQKYAEAVEPKVNAVVGTSETVLVKGYPTKGVVGDNALGNLIADGMKFEMNSDFALMNGGGVRDNLDAGPITWGELFNIQPFGNTLVTLDVTGAQFEEILNAMINPSFGPDSFIAGARYTWDTGTNKVARLYLADGRPVDPNAVYSLTVNNFMYNQTSEKYRRLQECGRNVVNGPEDVTATVNYVKSFTAPLHYAAEGRMSTDVTAPVTAAAVDGVSGEAYNRADVKVTLSAQDAGGIGVRETRYRINEGGWESADSGGFIVTGEGRNVVDYRSVDKVGNVESAKQLVILIDKTAPVIENPGEWTVYPYEAVSFTPNLTDNLSGVRRVNLYLDGVAVDGTLSVDPWTWDPGVHTVRVTAEDAAGNTDELEFTIRVVLDADHLDEVIGAALTAGKITDAGIAASLQDKVNAVQAAAHDHTRANILNALANQVRAQAGKKMERDFAQTLLAYIAYLQQ